MLKRFALLLGRMLKQFAWKGKRKKQSEEKALVLKQVVCWREWKGLVVKLPEWTEIGSKEFVWMEMKWTGRMLCETEWLESLSQGIHIVFLRSSLLQSSVCNLTIS